jgi:hypothetical protein
MKPEVVVALCALWISVLSLAFSIYYGWCTRDHNRRTVKPLPYVASSDFENLLAVRLWNYGNGLLILQKVLTRKAKDDLSGHLIDLLPSLPGGLYFSNYVKVRPGRAVPPGGSLTLFEFTVDESNAMALAFRDELRDILGHLVMDVNYTDIYETKFPTYVKDFVWFHRNKNANKAMQSARYTRG